MNRSPVKSGMYVQRDRATKRRRDRDEPFAPSPDLRKQLYAWMDERLPLANLEDVQALDRKRFLQETGNIAIAPGERLRMLAIHAEDAIYWEKQPDGWFTLRSIYEHALRFNEPDRWLVHLSMAISVELIVSVQSDPVIQRRIAADGLVAASRAVELASNHPEAHFLLGRIHYALDQLPEALQCFEAGVAVDPNHGWSALYRAFTLHDLQRWREAIEAYDAVPLECFKGPKAWNIDWLKECRAWCRLQQGDREAALTEFLKLLTRYEADLGSTRIVNPLYLFRAAVGPLRAELRERALDLARRLEFSEWFQDLDSPTITCGQASNQPVRDLS